MKPEIIISEDEQKLLEESPEELLEDIRNIVNTYTKNREDRLPKITSLVQRELELLDFAFANVLTLWVIFHSRQNDDIPMLWFNDNKLTSLCFTSLLQNIADSISIVRNLSGAGNHSRLVFRYLVETFDFTIACAGDEATFMDFIKSFDAEEDTLKHWRKNLSPGRIRKTLSNIEMNIIGAEPEVVAHLHEMRKDTYSWLSRAGHVDFIAYIGDSVTDSYVEMATATLRSLLQYLAYSQTFFATLLIGKHRWFPELENDNHTPDDVERQLLEKKCFIRIKRFADNYTIYRREQEGIF
ncbi:hypothetical protein [Egbenema bharatensis]|uniref:hypothetical protein n=1 Tax=Egbenema bharatensis TaxID=3463334 RepID=UPI003A87CB24